MQVSILTDWQINPLYPTDMLEPGQIVNRGLNNGSMAGSLGNIKDPMKKPGINEDGGLVAEKENQLVAIVIDGHYGRDTTEYLIDQMLHEIESGLWTHSDGKFDEFMYERCNDYSQSILEILREQEAVGEASYTIVSIDLNNLILCYYMVGDILLFVQDPNRAWSINYQIGSRQFYEWINRHDLLGYHYGFVSLTRGSKVLLATDGLIDIPTFRLQEINELFEISDFNATDYVNYALKNNQPKEDDNITVVCIEI